ncbi:hypothetical protein [Trichodesmium erythraeum]
MYGSIGDDYLLGKADNIRSG